VHHPFDRVDETILLLYISPVVNAITVINICPEEREVSSQLPQLADEK
jgi:cell division protein FtsL